jgi:hypothetical protein
MMLARYQRRVSGVDRETAATVLEMLRVQWKLRGRDSLFQALDESGHDQADLVLCLLRVNTKLSLRHAERIVGRRIKHCPPALQGFRPIPLRSRDSDVDRRPVLRVVAVPQLPSGRRPWLRHWHLFKVGLTVDQLRRRGVTSRDLRLVQRRKWVTLGRA